MKKAGLGAMALAGALFSAFGVVSATPQDQKVLLPYVGAKDGMFTAVSYVYSDNGSAPRSVHFIYLIKDDLTKNLDKPCEHYDGRVDTTPNDLDTVVIQGNGGYIQAAIVDDAGDDGADIPQKGEGLLVLEATDTNDKIVAEAHVVVTTTRGVYSFRALQLDTDDTLKNENTIGNQTGGNTTVMFFPENIAETYLYFIADAENSTENYTQAKSTYGAVSTLSTNNVAYDRSEREYSGIKGVKYTCAAIVHIKDILGAQYNVLKNTGGWFSLVEGNKTTSNGTAAWKIEVSDLYGATVTPLQPLDYAR